jgi:lysophospholipase L1-like esterase
MNLKLKLSGGNNVATNEYLRTLKSFGYNLPPHLFKIISLSEQKLKDSGVWDKLSIINLMIGNVNTFTINWKFNSNVPQIAINTNFTSADYSNKYGMTGDGTSKYINCGVTFSSQNIKTQDFSVGFYSRSSYAKGTPIGQSFSGNFYIAAGSSTMGGQKTSRVNNSITLPHHIFDGCVTFTGNDSNVTSYLGDQIYAITSATTTSDTIIGNITVFQYASSQYYDGNICSYYVGKYLTPQELKILVNVLEDINIACGRREKNRNIYFGDSTVWGVGDSGISARWSTLVNNNIGGLEVNSGISGNVYQNSGLSLYDDNGYNRFSASVISQKPTRVFILYGLNDLRYNGIEFNVSHFETQLDEKIKILISMGMNPLNIILLSPSYINPTKYSTGAPFNGGSVLIHEQYVNSVYNIAINNGIKYADAYNTMLNGGGNSLVGFDGIHPNGNGYNIIKNCVMQVLI